jgi:hypothetical protein
MGLGFGRVLQKSGYHLRFRCRDFIIQARGQATPGR